MEVKTFLMMGLPGAGKGTQARLLADKLGGSVVDSGARCREYAKLDTFFGRKTKAVIDSGDLMPEWFSIYLFEDALIGLEPSQAVVFEGAGRKLLEAQEFDGAANWLERPYRVVYLSAPEEALRARLLERAHIEGRADDAAQAIDLRFARFKEHTLASIDFFRKRGVLVEVNADQPVEAVHEALMQALGAPAGASLTVA